MKIIKLKPYEEYIYEDDRPFMVITEYGITYGRSHYNTVYYYLNGRLHRKPAAGPYTIESVAIIVVPPRNYKGGNWITGFKPVGE
jgi:hypothetical protein